MRAKMRTDPNAFAEGLGAWMARVTDDDGLLAAEAAVEVLAEILILAGHNFSGGKFGG